MAKKMRTCGTCGNEIAKSAKVCPHCGAKQKGGKLKTILIALVVFIVIVAVAGGGGKKGATKVEKTEDQAQEQSAEQKEAPKQEEAKQEEGPTVFSIGDTADLDGVQVTLNTAILSHGSEYVNHKDGNVFMGLIFDINNTSDKDVAISSLASFEAYCDDYSVNPDLIGYQCPEWDGYDQLDGSVAAGKKMFGVIAYQVPENFDKFEIAVTPDFWSGQDIAFEFTHDACDSSSL